MNSFDGKRLKNRRERRGLTKKSLAQEAGVNQRYITEWEESEGQVVPNEKQLVKLAKALDTDVRYFSMPWVGGVGEKNISFRAPTKMSRRNINAAVAFAQDGKEIGDWISSNYDCPKPDLPEINAIDTSPEHAALLVREAWGLGQAPIANMVRLLELHGVFVFSANGTAGIDFDAFSFFSDYRPYVFLSTNKSPERDRFDAAHELGHLLLHQHNDELSSKEREQEANDFASAFLMPRSGLLAQIPYSLSFEKIKVLKKGWGVAASALCVRLHKLDVLTDWTYHALFVRLSKEGYRAGEPDGMRYREQSKIMDFVMHDLYANHDAETLSRETGETMRDISDFAFGLKMVIKNKRKPGIGTGTRELDEKQF
ncbi:XRE family transcriptional regulator [Bifidobacterium sp. ESL0728]|uniref:helix-turn-helix domain-containing protein n=1 Tax=Bifidobacterium sp. ESL0728 TaxID=2983220 RepID=UPI0023F9FE0A|nr:XRE family transcriptional regulator [Bifidobacterium sp. ESL0728]WEV58423.1 XRE family transcriptional regulator [Bifidobacterium sp. ESL0728]